MTTIEEDILDGTSEMLVEGIYRGIPFVGVKRRYACGYAILPDNHPLCFQQEDPSPYGFRPEYLSVTFLKQEAWKGKKQWIAGFSSGDECFASNTNLPVHFPTQEEMTLRCHQFIDELLAD